MLLLKIFYRINSKLKILFYKCIYGKRVKFGKNIVFRKGFSLVIEKNGTVEIGNGCFFNNFCSINSLKNIKIGNNSIFGENVKLYDHDHVFKNNELIKKQGYKLGNIIIGDNCWLCSNVVVLKNVLIGDNCVIGANVKVMNDIAPNSLVKNKESIEIKEVIRCE